MEIHEGSLLLGVMIGAAIGCFLTFVLGVLAEKWEEAQWSAEPPRACAVWVSTSRDGRHWSEPHEPMTDQERDVSQMLLRADETQRPCLGRAPL